MIHYTVWKWVDWANQAIIPGRGQLIGFDVKYDFFNPIDLIPVIGPMGKLHKASKLAKQAPKIKYYAVAGMGVVGDVLIAKELVEWYNTRYRSESSSVARRGNAVGPGGGKKPSKKGKSDWRRPKRIALPLHSYGGYNPCPKGYVKKKIKGKWFCVRK